MPITTATEQEEYQLWLSKLSTNQITIGSDRMPPLGQTGKVVHNETFGYNNYTKLNTTTASGNWATGWVQNPTVASPTPLPDTYVVSPTWQVNLNDKAMFRGTSQIAINGEYDYFFRWEQSLNSSQLSPLIRADLRLVAYDTNQNCRFGLKSLSGTTQGQYIPFFSLDGGDNNGGNLSIILNNNTLYTIVGRLSSRLSGSTYAATGNIMAYESGTTQPGNWMTETYSASGINHWQFQAVGFGGQTYDASGSAIFKWLTVEKYTKTEIEPIETAVNLALSTRVYSDLEDARTQVATLIEGIAKETFTAQLNTLTTLTPTLTPTPTPTPTPTNTLYIGKAIFPIDGGTENDVINVNTMISNNDTVERDVTIILALYYNNQLKQIVATPSEHVLISAGAVVQRELSLVVPKISEGYKIKYFVWDALTTLKPYESKVEQLVKLLKKSSTILPLADAYVRDGTWANTNYGSNVGLWVKTDGEVGYSIKSYLKFDMNSYGSDVASAKLKIYVYGAPSSDTTLKVYSVATDTWGESTITWNNAPAIGSIVGSTIFNGSVTGWNEFDLTDYVKSEFTGDKIVSICIENPVDNNTLIMFDSKESTNKPYLEIVAP